MQSGSQPHFNWRPGKKSALKVYLNSENMKQFQNADREFILRWLAPSDSLDFPKALKVCYLSKYVNDPT